MGRAQRAPRPRRNARATRPRSSRAGGRRGIAIAQNLRRDVDEWREAYYAGASDTTRELLNHWFDRDHDASAATASRFEFRYYFCQREAIETLIYLKEVAAARTPLAGHRRVRRRRTPNVAALGITEEEDALDSLRVQDGDRRRQDEGHEPGHRVELLPRAPRESDSPMARHFVVIAPNLTVFERLKEDFSPKGGRTSSTADPLIPPRMARRLEPVRRPPGRGERRGDRRVRSTSRTSTASTTPSTRATEGRGDLRLDGPDGLEGEGARHRRGASRPHHRHTSASWC